MKPTLVSALLLLVSGCGPRLTVGTATASWHSFGETQDLGQLVHGNRRAEAEARISRAYLVWCGYPGVMAGSGLTLVGALAVAPSKTTTIAGALLLGQGLATLVTVAMCFEQAKVHAVRAAAIYSGTGGDR
jgi:hypothetical protein